MQLAIDRTCWLLQRYAKSAASVGYCSAVWVRAGFATCSFFWNSVAATKMRPVFGFTSP